MDEKSASASEIFSGAMQDHDRASIIGEPTYGKGLVQRVYPLSSGSGLALTTAFYYTPSGRSIQKPLRGVELSAASTMSQGPFKTDKGRMVRGGEAFSRMKSCLPESQSRLQVGAGCHRLFHFLRDRIFAHPRHPGKFRGPRLDAG